MVSGASHGPQGIEVAERSLKLSNHKVAPRHEEITAVIQLKAREQPKELAALEFSFSLSLLQGKERECTINDCTSIPNPNSQLYEKGYNMTNCG